MKNLNKYIFKVILNRYAYLLLESVSFTFLFYLFVIKSFFQYLHKYEV